MRRCYHALGQFQESVGITPIATCRMVWAKYRTTSGSVGIIPISMEIIPTSVEWFEQSVIQENV